MAPSSHIVLDISPAAQARGIFRENLVHFPPKHLGEDLATDGPGYGKKNLAVVPGLQKWLRIWTALYVLIKSILFQNFENIALFSPPFLRVEKLHSCQGERTKELSNLDEHLVVFQTVLLVLKKVIQNPFYVLQLALSTLLNELPKVTASFCNFFGMVFNILCLTSSCMAHNRLSHHNNYLKCINKWTLKTIT